MQNITLAERLHELVLAKDSKYQETAHWSKVTVRPTEVQEAGDWLESRGLKRGNTKDRHDWLLPLSTLFLIKNPRVATEFKLRWG